MFMQSKRRLEPVLSKKIFPSTYMRNLRPEYYSDTEDRASYVLEPALLAYHLDTITSRNQTNDFELFCRKLCERVICPNLRPQTGPEGGGDAKTDSETYPVSDEVAITYIGSPNSGKERWAFAFSAKKTWAQKVRSDVTGIIGTGRAYDKIICVTSRAAKAKDRARLEDELAKLHGISIVIHDQSWILKEVIDADRKDLAFNYLSVGAAKTDALRLGPEDYSRARQLADIEKAIDDPTAYVGIERQRVAEALIAAKLSRGLERPRFETDGRFSRAIKFADADGVTRQKLEARYEQIWTAFWWFDDFSFLNDSYDAFQAQALTSDNAKNIEFLCNLRQLLVNSVVHGHMTRDECHLKDRTAALVAALTALAAEGHRPNNALEAEASLLFIRLNDRVIGDEEGELSELWKEFEIILDKAASLGEFDADNLIQMTDVAGQLAGNDRAYNSLVEKLADFVSNRRSEGEGALILLSRAMKLDFSEHFEMIRLLGKAAYGLSKKEYREDLIKALHHLMVAYKSAGLNWAARATCLFVGATLVIESEEGSQLAPSFVPTIKFLAWEALQVRHIPDALFSLQLLNGALASLPLDEASKARVKNDLFELDCTLGGIFLNAADIELAKVESLPDILEGLQLFSARSCLMYTLGYLAELHADGSIPESESDATVHEMFSVVASQPAAKSCMGPFILNGEDRETFSTSILGMTVSVSVLGTEHSLVLGEAIVGSLEAFFATILEQRVIAHTECVRITVVEDCSIDKPTLSFDKIKMSAAVTWPAHLSPANFEHQTEVRGLLFSVCAELLAATCMIEDLDGLIHSLFTSEGVQQRMAMVATAGNSHSRLTLKMVTRMSEWEGQQRRSYPMRPPRPALDVLNLSEDGDDHSPVGDRIQMPKSHQALNVLSVVDVHAWDQARWKGTAYAELTYLPPCIALVFQNREAAQSIFARWRERFGSVDEDDEIYISIIRDLPEHAPSHYCLMLTSKLPEEGSEKPDRTFIMASRSMVMTPSDGVNLTRFLDHYKQVGNYLLIPAILADDGSPELLIPQGILKSKLTVTTAAQVQENDLEAIALHRHFGPDGA